MEKESLQPYQSQSLETNLEYAKDSTNLQRPQEQSISHPPLDQTNPQPPQLKTNFHPPQIQTNFQPPQIQASMQPLQNINNSEQTQITITGSPQKSIVTKVKLSDELNIFDWFRTTDIINQIAEKAKHSVDTVITALDPGMKEYLYSGGNINIMVISDADNLISPIRDSFQSAFGRATVTAARHKTTEAALEYPIKLACGLNEGISVAKERVKRLRSDTNGVPQNQVIVAIQPCVVNLIGDGKVNTSSTSSGIKLIENLPRWFLTYCMVIEDPVLLTTMNSFSQFIPIEDDVVATAKNSKFPEGFHDKHLGFPISIDDIMNSSLRLLPKESSDLDDCQWLKVWSGLSESQIICQLSNSLAYLYRRKWDECVN